MERVYCVPEARRPQSCILTETQSSKEQEAVTFVSGGSSLTTRNNHSDYPVIHAGRIEDIEQVRKIFGTYYDKPVKNWSIIDEILQLVDCHTITVELLAKQMKVLGMSERDFVISP